MFRKIIAGIFCIAVAASSLSSCGNDSNTMTTNGTDSDKTTSASADETTAAAETTTVENVDIANFTAPEKGDTIIVMNVKDYGTVKFRLFPEYAEKGVENFVELAKKGYYDGLKFHRVIADFMVQGGDPQGTGIGVKAYGAASSTAARMLTLSMLLVLLLTLTAEAQLPTEASSTW